MAVSKCNRDNSRLCWKNSKSRIWTTRSDRYELCTSKALPFGGKHSEDYYLPKATKIARVNAPPAIIDWNVREPNDPDFARLSGGEVGAWGIPASNFVRGIIAKEGSVVYSYTYYAYTLGEASKNRLSLGGVYLNSDQTASNQRMLYMSDYSRSASDISSGWSSLGYVSPNHTALRLS